MDHDDHHDGHPSDGVGLPAHKDATTAIVVNGRRCEVGTAEITHDQLVRLAFPGERHGESTSLSVTFQHGPLAARQGILSPSGRTSIADGQTFSVVRTDRS